MKQFASGYWIIKGLLFLILFLGSASGTSEASITLAWDPVIVNADGSPCTDLAGYKIYYDTDQTGAPYDGTGLTEGDSPIDVPLSSLSDPSNPEFVLSGLAAAETYYISVTAYDSSNNESGYSNETTVVEAAADSDNDGLSDSVETLYGLNPNAQDSDGDGISDLVEFGPFQTPLDSDGDGTYDALDLDSDNDGSADSVEGSSDSDNDGLPNYRDINDMDGPSGDQDGDGISNIDETTYGLNPNLTDSDHDGASDLAEWGSSNMPVDTDADGLIDALDTDSDDDGASDLDEDGADSDQDGILDRVDNQAATMVTPQGKMSVVISHPTARLVQTEFIETVVSSGSQPNVSFPYGGVEYQIADISAGEIVWVTIVMPEVLPANAEYWKYDDTNGFQQISSEVSGNEISFQLTDGGSGDGDGTANALIVDPGYIGIPQTESVPATTGTNADPSSGGGGGCSVAGGGGSGSSPDLIWFVLPVSLVLFLRKKHLSQRRRGLRARR